MNNIDQVLLQAPLVGAFIIFAIYSLRAFLEALDKRDTAYELRNKAMIETITNLNLAICGKIEDFSEKHDEHDKYMRSSISKRGAAK